MFCRWSTITARLAAVAKITVAHGSLEQQAEDRQRDGRDERCERCVAEEHERREPDHEADAGGERRERKHDPAAGRDHLAALAEAEPDRARMPEHRGRTRQHSDPLAAELDADSAGTKPLATSSSATGTPSHRP